MIYMHDRLVKLARTYFQSFDFPHQRHPILKPQSHIHMHGLSLRVTRQPSLAQLPTDTALLHATEGNAVVGVVAAVDPDHAGLDALGDAVGARDILGEDGAAETVRRVVGHVEGILFRLEARDHDEGPEDLFAVDAHAGLDVREDGRLDEESFVGGGALGEGFAAGDECRAFFLAGFDVCQDTLVLGFGYLRPLEGGFGEGVADDGDILDLLLEGV